ncbi:MAG TPA: tRNA (adenosine(37)-N6)-threonylcarbamoyltransferase complex dimerization subunit type 1 TsaB [Phycisphaerales bacterium]|nr:tRNA (adenosine(37)-N6)-threonylcarbamoyltransferase complex dimerization subunit type 1 TsaB [Phycisphaerales bacterium]
MPPASSKRSQASLVVALETSQRLASVALRDRAGRVHEEALSPRKRHDDDLMPAIDRMFRRAGLQSTDLRGGAVCVSIGPGGFTGLRIAIATAKMFAEALDVRLVAVPSALVAAESTLGSEVSGRRSEVSQALSALVALACKNDTLWATRLRRKSENEEWTIEGEAGIAQAESLDIAGAQVVLADVYFPDAARTRAQSAGASIIEPMFSARACLIVGERMLARGETTDPLRLLPAYPRQPEAVTIWEQRGKA